MFHENFLGGHTHSNFFNIRVFYFENYNYKNYLQVGLIVNIRYSDNNNELYFDLNVRDYN